MRVALGTAEFSGMLGVTVFGIFFTPVFYAVVRWLTGGEAPPAGPAEGLEAGKVVAVEAAAGDTPLTPSTGFVTAVYADGPHQK